VTRSRALSQMLFDPLLIIGTVCSVILGVVFYVRSDVPTGLGVIACLLGLLITMQVQTILIMHRKSEVNTRNARLSMTIERVPWMDTHIDRLARSAMNVNTEFADTPAIAAAERALLDCLERLDDLQRGRFNVPYGDLDLVHRLTAQATTEIWATSVQNIDLEWWESPRSQHYWNLQKEAMARGVKITRIFIYNEWNAQMQVLARAQLAAGVKVLRIPVSQVRTEWRTDAVIWDQICTFETRNNAAGEPTTNLFSVARQDLAAISIQFVRLQQNAARVEGD